MKTLSFLLALAAGVQAGSRQAPFQSPYTLDQMRNQQAVVDTTMGTFVIQLLPEAAPNHVGHFIKTAKDGGYDGTIFHRVVRYGVVQGGDPLSRDPSKVSLYGTGGLGELRREPNTLKHTAGAVSAVIRPNQPDSAGSQFFVCATDQPTLDGQYTVFGRVVEGLDVVQQISAVDADAEGHPKARVEIRSVTIRPTPPPKPVPFASDTPQELGRHRAVLETTKGDVTLEFLADRAPETVRNFLQLAEAGVYDGMLVHRVAPGFVIQTGSLAYRETPLTPAQQKIVHRLPPEFSDTPNLPGVVSMARGDDPASATTSFFICTGECRSLDGQYTVFARVVSGMDVVTAIEQVPASNEVPVDRVIVKRVRIED